MNSSSGTERIGRKSIKSQLRVGAVSGLALLIAMPVAVIAQEAPQQAETVVVTGLRGSLQRAVTQKRISDMITEQISAEQIGKLPDPSIAESLSRLPGLMGQRVNGEVEVINMRGTSPDFTTTLLNGRQQGTVADGRGVEVNQYPGELLAGATVYKTPDSAVPGQGLSGTIDLKTIRPLSRNGRTVALNFRVDTTTLQQLNPDVDKGGWRGSASYVNQFMDGTLGVAFGIAHNESTSQRQYQEIWGYDGNTNSTTNTLANAPIPNGHTTRAYSQQNTRNGFMGVIEYKPNDNSHTTADLYYSTFKQDELMRGIEGPMASWAGSTYRRDTGVQYGGALITNSGLITGVVPIFNNQFNVRDSEVIAGGINHEFKAGIWDLEADLSYSKASETGKKVEIFSALTQNRSAETYGIDWESDNFTQLKPALNYSDISKMYLGDSAPGGWGEGNNFDTNTDDSYSGLDLKAKTDIKDTFVGKLFDTIELGLNFTSHDRSKYASNDRICFKNWVNSPSNISATDTQGGSTPCGYTAITGTYRRSTNNLSALSVGNANLGFAGFGPLAAFNIRSAFDQNYIVKPNNDSGSLGRIWSLNEEVFTAFTRLHIDSEVLGRHIGGNLGVQFIDSDTEATGYSVSPSRVASVPQLTTGRNHYTDVLPSLNLSIDLIDKLKLRLGVAKQMARPRPDELRNSYIVNLNNVTNLTVPAACTGVIPPAPPAGMTYACLSGNGGNSYLKPWRATAYDVSLEYYLSSKSNIALAGFYKVLESSIYNLNVLTDFSNFTAGLPANVILLSNMGVFNSPQNAPGGRNNKEAYIKGFEASANLDFGDIFPGVPFIDGFGFSGSYNHNDTNFSASASALTAGEPPVINGNSLPGFSKESHSLTLYYEKYGIEARVSRRWRAGVRAEVEDFFKNRTTQFVLPDEVVDAQIRYTFRDGPLDGLALSLEGSNITDTLFLKQNGTRTPDGSLLANRTERYGARYLFGVSYKF